MAEAQDVQQETEDDSASIIFHLPTNENMFRVIENMNLRIPAVIPYINSLDACWISDLNEDDRTCYICNEDFAADQLTEQAEGQESPIRLTCPMCRSELFPALSDASSTRGMEERLGLLELYALQHDLSERDEGFRAELRVFLQERRERAAAQDAREFEGYQEPEVEDPESDDDDDAAGIGWYREQHRRLYLTNDEQTDEILDEALGDGLIDETLEEDGWTSEESELPQ